MRLRKCHQGSRSVSDNADEYSRLVSRCATGENEESSAVHDVLGLRHAIIVQIGIHHYDSVEIANHLVAQAKHVLSKRLTKETFSDVGNPET